MLDWLVKSKQTLDKKANLLVEIWFYGCPPGLATYWPSRSNFGGWPS
jgi:hypothetical protein